MDSDIEIDWVLIADYAMVDAGGKASIVGIFDRVFSPVFPSIQPSVFIVAAWRGAPNRVFAVELRVWSPAKDLLIGGQQQVQTGPEGKANGIFSLSPLPLPTPGEYIVELLAEGTTIASVPLFADPVETAP
jgi:hypothetical protein